MLSHSTARADGCSVALTPECTRYASLVIRIRATFDPTMNVLISVGVFPSRIA